MLCENVNLFFLLHDNAATRTTSIANNNNNIHVDKYPSVFGHQHDFGSSPVRRFNQI